MSGGKTRGTVRQIESDEELTRWWVNRSASTLLVIDVHRGWSGRCDSLTPLFDSKSIEFNECSDGDGDGDGGVGKGRMRVAFLAAEVPRFATKLADLMGGGDDGDARDVADGAAAGSSSSSYPPMSSATALPTASDLASGGCSPLFLAVRHGRIVSVVRGADRPALSRVVEEYLPRVTEDGDEAEDN